MSKSDKRTSLLHHGLNYNGKKFIARNLKLKKVLYVSAVFAKKK